MNIYSKFFNILSVMFILVSTVSFCIETLPMFDDSYVNKGGFRPLIFYTGIHHGPELHDPRTKLIDTVSAIRSAGP